MRNEDGSNTFINYPLHDCTDEDMANFHPHDEESLITENNWDNLLNMSIRDTLKCLDKSVYDEALLKPNSL